MGYDERWRGFSSLEKRTHNLISIGYSALGLRDYMVSNIIDYSHHMPSTHYEMTSVHLPMFSTLNP